MRFTYEQRKRPHIKDNTPPSAETAYPSADAAPGPGMEALMAGTARPSAAQKGRPFDLDTAMKAKMENAFGDLSGVKLYESQAVGQAGAEAITQGNEIAFAPGMANFSTRSGQERLGHELSHVMSQRSGQVRGSGFLNSPALEARADREGAMAAAGQQVCGGPVTNTFSGAVPSSVVAGAMQAKRDTETTWSSYAPVRWNERINSDEEGYENLGADKYVEFTETPGWWSKFWGGKVKKFKHRIERKAYELDEDEIKANKYNPENLKQLDLLHQKMEETGRKKKVKKAGDEIGNKNRGAWQALKSFFGSDDDRIRTEKGRSWNMNDVDNGIFIAKMKNMGRMMNDYPQLIRQLGNLNRDNSGGEMATGLNYRFRQGTSDTHHMFPLYMSSETDAVGEQAAEKRKRMDKIAAATKSHAADSEYSGNHELGHMLNFDLIKRKNWQENRGDWENKRDMRYNITADQLVDEALSKTLSKDEYENLVRYDRDSNKNDKDEKGNQIYFKKNQINLKASKLGPQLVSRGKFDKNGLEYPEYTTGHTSDYGTESASEFFAEAFADVYQHGKNARKASIELVKAYEKEFKKYENAYFDAYID